MTISPSGTRDGEATRVAPDLTGISGFSTDVDNDGLPTLAAIGPIRVVLHSDMTLQRQALKALLAQDSRVVCLDEAAEPEECLTVSLRHDANVVIHNVDRRDGNGFDSLTALVDADHAPRVLVIGDGDDSGRILALYRAGAAGYLPNHGTAGDLYEALELISRGGSYIRPDAVRAIANGLHDESKDRSRNGARARVAQLSRRERAVMLLVARGFNGPEIAAKLKISPKTVDTYRHRIQQKIDVHHRSDCLNLALAAGLIGCK